MADGNMNANADADGGGAAVGLGRLQANCIVRARRTPPQFFFLLQNPRARLAQRTSRPCGLEKRERESSTAVDEEEGAKCV